jgi:hypothetical protein
MEFADYGRFIEIRWHKITRNRKALSQNSTNKALFSIDRNFGKIKNTNWYSRTAYGSQNRLIAKLSEQLPAELLEKMKSSFINQRLILPL